MNLDALHFERKSPLDVSHTPSGDFRPIHEIFPIPCFPWLASSKPKKRDVKMTDAEWHVCHNLHASKGCNS